MSKSMPILEHIEELRNRAIKIFIGVGALTLIFFMFQLRFLRIGAFLIPYPYPDVFQNMASQVISILRQQVLPTYVQIIVTTPSDAFISEMYIALFLGVVSGMPLIAYEFWAYVSPALYQKEKMVIIKLTLPAVILFLIGCAFGYVFIVPFAFSFLYAYAANIGIITYITISDFIMFIIMFCVAMGVTFELPVVMWGVTKLGLIKPESYKKNLRYFIVFAVVYGAFITPDGSGITMWLVAIPMIFLYGLGYIFAKKTVK